MDVESTNAQAEESKPATALSEADTTVQAEVKEETVGEVLNSQKQKPKEETVPLSTFLEIKNENKAMHKEMKELKKSIEQGANKKEVNSTIKALSEKHGVDADFLEDFAVAVRQEAKKEVEEELSSKLRPIEEKEKAEKFDKVFNQHYTKALEQLPEFDGVVNKEVIKTLSLNPANANKTFTQLIEEAYGHLVSGKRTIDVANSRNSRLETGEIDVKRANTDIEYFREIKSNPHLLKKYNDMISKDLFGKM